MKPSPPLLVHVNTPARTQEGVGSCEPAAGVDAAPSSRGTHELTASTSPLPETSAPIPKVSGASKLVAMRTIQHTIATEKQTHAAFLAQLAAGLRSGVISGTEAARLTTERADAVLKIADRLAVMALGAPPLDPATQRPIGYAVFGTGSYGRMELAPYSDLDFGVVVGTHTDEMNAWVKAWATHVESIVKEIGGGALQSCREMSPSGAFGPFFIGSPEELAARATGTAADLAQRAPREREFIMTGLSTSRLALASPDGLEVHARFERAMREALGPGAPTLDPSSARAELVDALLGSMRDPFGVPERKKSWFLGPNGENVERPVLKQHQPVSPEQALADNEVNIKHDVLRALQMPVQALRVMFGIDACEMQGVLAWLVANERMDPALADKLRGVLDVTLKLRALNQLDAKGPVDRLRSITDADKKQIRVMVAVLFRFRQGMESAKADKNGFSLA